MTRDKTTKPVLLSERRARAEQSLIASVIANKPTRAEMEELLAICPRGSCKHRDFEPFWNAAADIHAAGNEVNGVTLFDALTGVWEGGDLASTLAGYMRTPDYPGAVEWWAGRVHEINTLESLQFLLEQFAGRMGDQMTESGAIVAELQSELMKYGEAVTTDSTLDGLMRSIVEDVQKGSAARPLPSPWVTLNSVLKGGIAPGELAVLAARPGMGKTAMAGCWAVETARNVGPVLFVSCEVKDKTIGARLIAREGKIDNRAFREGLGSSMAILPQIEQAADVLSAIPLQVVDTSRQAITPMQVRRLARKMKHGPAMVVVDYLQLMYPDTRHDSREREIADMSRSMKRLAVELDCPVLLLSQLNRKVEESSREPQLSDLRESGAVEQDADIVIMLHADKRDVDGADVPMQAIVRKGRSSGTGSAPLIFHKAYSDFSEGSFVRRRDRLQEYDL